MTRRKAPRAAGFRPTHGGYGLMRGVAHGNLDGRTRHAVTIRAVSEQIARDLGFSAYVEMPMPQRLLTEQVAVKATVLSLMAGHALTNGVVGHDGALKPPLDEHFLAFSNSLRLDLQALGLRREPKTVIDVAAMLARMRVQDHAEANAPSGTQPVSDPSQVAHPETTHAPGEST